MDPVALVDIPPFPHPPTPQVSQFLATLRQDLARGVGSRLDSLLSQTMYFGLSLARIGADLRPLAAPLFREAALAQFTRAAAAATDRFRQSMDAFTCMRARVTAAAASAHESGTGQVRADVEVRDGGGGLVAGEGAKDDTVRC